MKRRPTRLVASLRASYLWLEDKPLLIVLAAAGATVGVVLELASDAGWEHVWQQVHARHAWAWLPVCLPGELIAYGATC
jgi:hypothetical protein